MVKVGQMGQRLKIRNHRSRACFSRDPPPLLSDIANGSQHSWSNLGSTYDSLTPDSHYPLIRTGPRENPVYNSEFRG